MAGFLCKKSTMLHHSSALFLSKISGLNFQLSTRCTANMTRFQLFTQRKQLLFRGKTVVCSISKTVDMHHGLISENINMLLSFTCIYALKREKRGRCKEIGYPNPQESTPPALFLPPPTQWSWSVHIHNEMYQILPQVK